jgi:hypothetical protein
MYFEEGIFLFHLKQLININEGCSQIIGTSLRQAMYSTEAELDKAKLL